MRLRKILLCLMVLTGVAVTTASYVRGRVTDDTGEGLPGASVTIFSLPDTVPGLTAMTDENGEYVIPVDSAGRYLLLYSMTGTEPAALDVDVKEDTDTLTAEPVMLTENATMLGEVVVKGVKTAVISKQDTLEFNADSYHVRTNSNVEDLLKRLPGVEVGSDGSITSGGKSVTKILVDGEEFFSDDPKAATKNLPSSMIDKVQVVNRKSDLARLTGVDDGEEETVINLTVKKGMKNGWFGNVEAGYGTDDRYKYSFNINRFYNGNQISLIGGGNNINEMGFTDRGRGRFAGFGGLNGINTTRHIGINFNVGNKEKFRVGGNVIYSYSDRKAIQSSETEFLFPDSVSWQSSSGSARDKGHNVNADFRMQWKIDEANTIDFRPRFSYSHRDETLEEATALNAGDTHRTPVNNSEQQRRQRGDSYELSGNLIFNHNFLSHPGRSLSFQGRYNFSDSRTYEYSWSRIKYYLLSEQDEELYRYLHNRSWNSGVDGRITWTEPIGDASRGNYLTFAYSVNYKWNNADRLTYSLDPLLYNGTLASPPSDAPDGITADESLSNRFRNRFFTQEAQIGYKRITSKYNLEAGIIFSPASSQSEDLINSARNIPTRWVYNFSPFLRYRLKFGSGALRINYRARTSQPSMSQLQPVADISDPLHITVGNPELKPSFTQTVMAHFNQFDTESQRSLFAVLHAQYTNNNIASRTVTDAETGVRTTTYTNVNGDWNLMGMGMITQPFRNRNWRFEGRLRANYSSSAGFINGERNRSGNLGIAPELGLTFTSDIFQFSLGPSYSYQLATASMPDQPNRSIHSYGFNANAALYLPFGLELTSDLNMAHNSGYASGYNSNQWLWNAQLSYSLLRNKSLTLSFSVYDILQMKKNISRSVSAASIIDSRVNDLTRYCMFTITWKFNSFGSKKDIPEMDGMRGPGGHDGPPPGNERNGRPSAPPAGAPMGPPGM